jgi:hypothetical protein
MRHFFSNLKNAELMWWWDSDKRKKGYRKLRYPADAHLWMRFDEQYYLKFGKVLSNIRFALSTNGMNPFGERISTHSIWPGILMMYKPAYMVVLEEKVFLLSILIQGSKHLGIDINVFLEPLMQVMETLWKEGINVVDGFTQQHFNLRAIIFVTIHDYQALFILLG